MQPIRQPLTAGQLIMIILGCIFIPPLLCFGGCALLTVPLSGAARDAAREQNELVDKVNRELRESKQVESQPTKQKKTAQELADEAVAKGSTGAASTAAPAETSDGIVEDFRSEGRNIVGKVRNVTGKRVSFAMASFGLFDSEGNKVGSAFDTVSNWEAGEVWAVSAFIFDKRATQWRFDKFSGF